VRHESVGRRWQKGALNRGGDSKGTVINVTYHVSQHVSDQSRSLALPKHPLTPFTAYEFFALIGSSASSSLVENRNVGIMAAKGCEGAAKRVAKEGITI
jgi:hypothetical protein